MRLDDDHLCCMWIDECGVTKRRMIYIWQGPEYTYLDVNNVHPSPLLFFCFFFLSLLLHVRSWWWWWWWSKSTSAKTWSNSFLISWNLAQIAEEPPSFPHDFQLQLLWWWWAAAPPSWMGFMDDDDDDDEDLLRCFANVSEVVACVCEMMWWNMKDHE